MSIMIKPISFIPTIPTNLNVSTTENNLAGSFQAMLSDIKKSDEKIFGTMLGKVELHDLVTSVSMAETNLKILVSLRDSLMNAIQELTRMQI